MERFFTKNGVEGTTYEWQLVELKDKDGKELFSRNCEFPKSWSTNARLIAASKYFSDEENSLKQLVDRVVVNIAIAGQLQNVLENNSVFKDELTYILENQLASFNSPVWFNIGVPDRRQQASACFLLDVEDDMNSILDWMRTEGLIFQGGSGSGVNVSKLRAKDEPIGTRGTSSGPLSFMAAADALSGSIKSGGSTRRSAKLVVMDADHPDIEEFIGCKQRAENILRKFQEFSGEIDVNSDILAYIPYQNANNSVSVKDSFMGCVQDDTRWWLKARTLKGVNTHDKRIEAKELFHKIAKTAWECGDPGLFYHDTVNDWHTCKNSGPIISGNPCLEYVFLPNTACNLASINLLKFLAFDGNKPYFQIDKFIHVVEVMITAMEILVSYSDYPTPKIKEMSEKYRTLGLGYANLGAFLMSIGLPYDSESARVVAASITSLMTSAAYHQSHQIAEKIGSFAGFEANKEPFKQVMGLHMAAQLELEEKPVHWVPLSNIASIIGNAGTYWNQVTEADSFRNAQISLLAPTGTISFMMDCDTTGIEPEMALRKHKTLVGGGQLEIVNGNVKRALETLGYEAGVITRIERFIHTFNSLEACDDIKPEHLAVFDCAFGLRSISPMGHVLMVAAVQPFLSGSVSKTVNLPADSTVKDIEDIYMEAWNLGLKAISVYRDGSKVAQPVKSSVKLSEADSKVLVDALVNPPEPTQHLIDAFKQYNSDATDQSSQQQVSFNGPIELNLAPQPVRRRLPDTRVSLTHKFSVGGHEGYITVGKYPDGTPGEVFVTISKEGSTISGLLDAFATSVSLGLQFGVPLTSLIDKFKHSRFEPSGFTGNQAIPQASSVIDYLFKWLELEFKPLDTVVPRVSYSNGNGHTTMEEFNLQPKQQLQLVKQELIQTSGDTCITCGSIMQRTGNCRTCNNCGQNTGCA